MLMTTPSWQRPAAATSAPTQPLKQARPAGHAAQSTRVELRLRSWRGRRCSWRQRAGLGPSSLLLGCTCLSFGAELEPRDGWRDCSSAATRATPAPHRVPAPERSFSGLGECSGLAAALFALATSARRSSRGEERLARSRSSRRAAPAKHPSQSQSQSLPLSRSLAGWSLGSTLARPRPLRAAPRTARLHAYQRK